MPDWRAIVRERMDAGAGEDADMVEEMAQHLEVIYQEQLAAGASPQAAQQMTLDELQPGRWRELRSAVAARARPRAEVSLPGWNGLGRDVRHGVRLLRRSPGFAAAAILSLALGIGANAAVFQLLDALVLRSLPLPAPQRLARVALIAPHGCTGNVTGGAATAVTYALWQRLEAGQQGFTGLAAWYRASVAAGEGAHVHEVPAVLVSGGYFATLGITAARGRLFTAAADPPGCTGYRPPGVILSHGYWERAYGGAPVLGRTLAIEGHALPIIGITAAGFTGVDVGRGFEVALPLCAEPMVDGAPALLTDAQGWWLGVIGRLRPGWTLQRASAQLAAISPGMFAATVPPMYDARVRAAYLTDTLKAVPASTGVSNLRRQYEEPLWLLLALAGLVLLIACANLANLMLARAQVRRQEMAVRLALGAAPGRLARLLLMESLVLALIGAAAGAAVGWVGSRMLTAFLASNGETVLLNLAPDWRLLAVLAGLAVAACVLFGLAPALAAGRTAPVAALRAASRGTAAGARSRLRRGLAMAQVALALVLLVCALLFTATLRHLMEINPGFQAAHVVAGQVDMSQVPPARLASEKRQLLQALAVLPGVQAAASAEIIPLSGQGWNNYIALGGGKALQLTDFNAVSPDYFRTLRIPLLAGRVFNLGDTRTSPPVAIVSQAFARQYFHGRNPIGETFRVEGARGVLGPVHTIVGVAGDTKYLTLRESFVPILYEAAAQDTNDGPEFNVLLHSQAPSADVLAQANAAAAKIDPSISLSLDNLQQSIQSGLLREHLMADLAACFAALALLLAVIGLYGVIAYLAVQRRKEMGIRLALGASGASVVRLLLGEAWLLLGVGLVLGVGLAALAARLARALLFGVGTSDPRLLAAAVAALSVAGTLAALIPARRAARLDPMQTLSEE
ncbi:MAG: ADOP family duplicated permease [Terriglobales bacterium]